MATKFEVTVFYQKSDKYEEVDKKEIAVEDLPRFLYTYKIIESIDGLKAVKERRTFKISEPKGKITAIVIE